MQKPFEVMLIVVTGLLSLFWNTGHALSCFPTLPEQPKCPGEQASGRNDDFLLSNKIQGLSRGAHGGKELIVIVDTLTNFQSGKDVFGSIGEIGVHRGWFFAVLASHARSCEKLFACDIFSDGTLNVDRSGNGSIGEFLSNVAQAGIGSTVNIYDMSSISLLEHFNLPPVRLLSIDGGHTQTLTYMDLSFASRVLTDGGVAFLDDFMNTGWRGVQRGFSAFLVYHQRDRLVPFAFYHRKIRSVKWPVKTESKLLFTTLGHADLYQRLLLQAFPKSVIVNSDILKWSFEDRIDGGHLRNLYTLVNIML